MTKNRQTLSSIFEYSPGNYACFEFGLSIIRNRYICGRAKAWLDTNSYTVRLPIAGGWAAPLSLQVHELQPAIGTDFRTTSVKASNTNPLSVERGLLSQQILLVISLLHRGLYGVLRQCVSYVFFVSTCIKLSILTLNIIARVRTN